MHRQADEQPFGDSCKEQSRPEHTAGTKKRDQPLRDIRGHGDGDRDRHEGKPGAGGRVVEHLLQVQREQEELREADRRDDRGDQRPGAERRAAKDLERDERRRGPSLDREECRSEDGSCTEQEDRRRTPPALLRRAGQREDKHHQGRRHRDCARDVEVPMLEGATALGEEARNQRDECQADRQVDIEDPGPREVRGQDTAEQNANRSPGTGRRAPDAERNVPLTSVPEDGHQEREARGRKECAAESLDPAEDDERTRRPGQAAQVPSQA